MHHWHAMLRFDSFVLSKFLLEYSVMYIGGGAVLLIIVIILLIILL